MPNSLQHSPRVAAEVAVAKVAAGATIVDQKPCGRRKHSAPIATNLSSMSLLIASPSRQTNALRDGLSNVGINRSQGPTLVMQI
jgi:hypothetical protein